LTDFQIRKFCDCFGQELEAQTCEYCQQTKPVKCVTHDMENWKQCHDCGTIYPKYEAKMESEIENVVETSTNPFDEGKSIVGLGNKKPKNRYQKMKERIEKEKDKDIKAEQKKGNIVTVIE